MYKNYDKYSLSPLQCLDARKTSNISGIIVKEMARNEYKITNKMYCCCQYVLSWIMSCTFFLENTEVLKTQNSAISTDIGHIGISYTHMLTLVYAYGITVSHYQ